jgi:hypothetical protein
MKELSKEEILEAYKSLASSPRYRLSELEIFTMAVRWMEEQNKTMSREDIIRMARQAGCDPHDMTCDFSVDIDDLERLATLVAAAEREACAQLVDHILCEGGGTYGDAIRARGKE